MLIDELAISAQQKQIDALVPIFKPLEEHMLAGLEYPHLVCTVHNLGGVHFTISVTHANKIRIPKILLQTMPEIFKKRFEEELRKHVDQEKSTAMPVVAIISNDRTKIEWMIACVRTASTW